MPTNRKTSSHQIRPVTKKDIPGLLEMIHELAVYEKLEHVLVATEQDYDKALFGEKPSAEALIAQTAEGSLCGYAIFFQTFSSFKGRPGIWLEDIYVRPDFRSLGVGSTLLKSVACIAHERNAGRYEWCVLDWNQDAIDFYKRAGAKVLQEWKIVRTEGDAIAKLANG